MSWKKSVFENFKLYAVTDLREEDPAIFRKVEAAYRGGADIVQLRSKNLTDASLYRMGIRMRKIASRFRKLFFVNDRPDLALAVGADGIHVGQDDLPVRFVRKIVGKKFFVGLSTHNLAQALQAAGEDADYIAVGPIFGTPTKPTYRPVGLDLIRKLRGRIRIPFVCIGGIDQKNIRDVLKAGASRVAVVRAIFDAPDPFRAAQTLKETLETYAR